MTDKPRPGLFDGFLSSSNWKQLVRIVLAAFIVSRVWHETGPFTTCSIGLMFAENELEIILARWQEKMRGKKGR
jgi:hypothetical protein